MEALNPGSSCLENFRSSGVTQVVAQQIHLEMLRPCVTGIDISPMPVRHQCPDFMLMLMATAIRGLCSCAAGASQSH